MIELNAVVTAVENGYVVVEAASQGCGRCHEPGGCGGVSLGAMLCSSPRQLRVRNGLTLPVHVGDSIDIGVADGVLRRGALAAYVAPLAGLLAGALLGGMIGETWAVAGSLAGLGGGWWATKQFRKKAEDGAGELVIVRHHPSRIPREGLG